MQFREAELFATRAKINDLLSKGAASKASILAFVVNMQPLAYYTHIIDCTILKILALSVLYILCVVAN